MKANNILILFGILISLLISSCDEVNTPKPRGYFRIELPEKSYRTFDSACPFTFSYPQYANILKDQSPAGEKCWLNVDFPELNATMHFSYKEVNNDLRQYLEDSRTLAMKHTQRADDIREIPVIKDSTDVYGLIYDIRGNAASSLQFYLTDSTNHFLRGSLYFNSAPNIDSVSPVLDFLKEDVDRMIETFRWK